MNSDNRVIIAWIIWMKMRIWNQTCQKPKNQSSINGEKKWNSQRKLFHHNALALWEMFHFRPKYHLPIFSSISNILMKHEKPNSVNSKRFQWRIKSPLLVQKSKKNQLRRLVHYHRANGEAHLFVKLVIDWPSFVQSECCFKLSNEFIASENIHMYL